jgi:hypothetical protein
VLTNYRDDSPRADTGQSIPEHLLTRRASNYLISKGLHGVIENLRVIAVYRRFARVQSAIVVE